jgi:GntR family transcriptional regulator/MocR family aminotransferase
MVLPEKLADLFKEKLGFYSCSVPTYEQLVIASLLDSGNFERHINRVRRHKRRELPI